VTSVRGEMAGFVRSLQDAICAALERVDGGRFREDRWEREGGGGGHTRVLEDGAVFEKAGVNTSEVFGELTEAFAKKLPGSGRTFYAAGISLVLHPRNPLAPTVHANFRYLEQGGATWFGGGADLTPYYLFDEDARHFHSVWKDACDAHDPAYYPRFKKECDGYFFLKHRGEARGVGGIFFDHLHTDVRKDFAFAKTCGEAFLSAYLPILERRHALPYSDAQRVWQEIRRGRYVEFNLIHDRGTLFGLETNGRTESILMSLPPRVRWVYDHHPEPASEEARLIEVLRSPREWV
jgi:coproporphyrinogen III oxidase